MDFFKNYKLFIPFDDIDTLNVKFSNKSFAKNRAIINNSQSTKYCIKSVYVEANVATVGGNATIHEYIVSPRNPNLTSHEGIVFNKSMKTLVAFPTDRTGEYVIPMTVDSIRRYAFRGSSIEKIICPQGLKKIKKGAFGYSNINTVIVNDECHSIESGAFSHCNNLSHVKLGSSLKEIKSYTFDYCTNIQEIVIPDSVDTIEEYAFSNSWINTLTIRCHQNMVIKKDAFLHSTIENINLLGSVEGVIEDETLLALIEKQNV